VEKKNMSMVGRVLLAALVGSTLAACGGGGGDGATALPNKQAGQGITVGEPNGGIPVVSEYIKLAREASCAEARNNLYLVDNKYVFWDRAGRCADASYAQTLMGATPQAVLCQSGQTIAGPRTVCTGEGPQALFETMVKNLDKDDLGLGAGHKVEAIPFLPKSGTAIAFTQVVSQAFSSITAPRQVVVKDAAAWAALWAEHKQSGNPAPEVDFSRNMVVALFAGETASGCKSTSIVKVVSRDGKMVVEYQERDLATLAPCLPVVTQPMQAVSVPRVDAKVEFLKVAAEDAAYRTIDQTTQSGVRTERNVVVRDGATWAALWLEHAGSDKVIPDIDFGKEMVIAVFAGGLPTGCHSSGIESIRFADGKLNVVRVDTLPRPEVVCTAMMVYPAQLVTVERSDVPVEFSKQTRATK
jgi:hypothetical protein